MATTKDTYRDKYCARNMGDDSEGVEPVLTVSIPERATQPRPQNGAVFYTKWQLIFKFSWKLLISNLGSWDSFPQDRTL